MEEVRKAEEKFSAILHFLKEYDGPPMNIMEVCGSHTGAIMKNGIPGLLSPNIHLISGPGCPVCVTPTAYIDRLIELSLEPNTCVVTFGDLMRVPGSRKSLQEVKGEGGQVEMVYSPMDALSLAQNDPNVTFVFAAIGFETTIPVYAMLLEQARKRKIRNISLLTSLKTMPEVIQFLCSQDTDLNGFLAPGHVAVVTGYQAFEPLALKYHLPFGVAGFQGKELMIALYGIVKHYGQGVVKNYYPAVVTREGNPVARARVEKYFEPCDAVWRGMGAVPDSGLKLRTEWEGYDAGSEGLDEDAPLNPLCSCAQVLLGKKEPSQCPLFGTVCTPLHPQGACMVSDEGSCRSHYLMQG